MNSITFAGIQRYSLFSPNHVGNDAAIFSGVACFLEENGHKVEMFTEQEFLTKPLPQKHVFTMMRSKAAVRNLQLLESRGVVSINSAHGIENCTREKMTSLLLENRVPHPDSLILNTQERISEVNFPDGFEPCWAKRADFHAIHREDVTYARTIDELRDFIDE